MENEEISLIKELKGFSGCKLLLYNSNHGLFVRKISKSEKYNNRLKEQMLKQRFFYENIANDKISTPKILNSGLLDNLFYFDMEYIPGLTLIEKISKANLHELIDISDNLIKIIALMKLQVSNEKEDLPKKVLDKINEIETTLPNIHQPLLNKLKVASRELPTLFRTFCHGDLTLENIIYEPNSKKYYLIDFLDSFSNHYWFDIAKMFQDIDGNWYSFRNNELNTVDMQTKMAFIKGMKIKSIEEEYLKHHPLFLALTFLRILPYAEEKHHPYLISVINKNISDLSSL